MTDGEHLVENIIFGWKEGRDTNDILKDPANQYILKNMKEYYNLPSWVFVRICDHVVYGLYDGKFPET